MEEIKQKKKHQRVKSELIADGVQFNTLISKLSKAQFVNYVSSMADKHYEAFKYGMFNMIISNEINNKLFLEPLHQIVNRNTDNIDNIDNIDNNENKMEIDDNDQDDNDQNDNDQDNKLTLNDIHSDGLKIISSFLTFDKLLAFSLVNKNAYMAICKSYEIYHFSEDHVNRLTKWIHNTEDYKKVSILSCVKNNIGIILNENINNTKTNQILHPKLLETANSCTSYAIYGEMNNYLTTFISATPNVSSLSLCLIHNNDLNGNIQHISDFLLSLCQKNLKKLRLQFGISPLISEDQSFMEYEQGERMIINVLNDKLLQGIDNIGVDFSYGILNHIINTMSKHGIRKSSIEIEMIEDDFDDKYITYIQQNDSIGLGIADFVYKKAGNKNPIKKIVKDLKDVYEEVIVTCCMSDGRKGIASFGQKCCFKGCNKTFDIRKQLRKHIKEYHQGNYVCAACGKDCKNNNHYKKHKHVLL